RAYRREHVPSGRAQSRQEPVEETHMTAPIRNIAASETVKAGSDAAPAAGSNQAPDVTYRDLREWIEEARKLGEIRAERGLTWKNDLGMVAERALHDEPPPCFVFEDVPGPIKGSRVLTNFFGGRRKNMTLGFPAELSKLELSEGFRRHFM